MKRVISTIACVALVSCLCLTGCVQQNKVATSADTEPTTQSTETKPKAVNAASLYEVQNLTVPYELQGVSLLLNPDWTVKETNAAGSYIKAGEGPNFMLHAVLNGRAEELGTIWSAFYSGDDVPEELKSWSDNGIDYKEGIVRKSSSNYLVLAGADTATGNGFGLTFLASEDDLTEAEMLTLFDGVVATITYDPSKTTADYNEVYRAEQGTTSSNNTSSSTPAEPKATVSQQNALKMANSYLKSMPFSYTGLIEQLEYEQFSTEDATYGADNCGADWNEQAAKMAASYLSTMSFSRGGLIDQLMFEGFTEEQATYGADSVGL